MKKRTYTKAGVAAVLLGITVFSSGCQNGAQTPANTSGAPLTAPAQTTNIITVTGSEEVKVVPDMAEITCSIYSRGDSATACQEANTQDLNSALAAFQKLGIADSSIQTSSYGMQPIRNWSSDTQEIIGYEMTTSLTLSDVPLDQTGSILTQAVDAGINSIDEVRYFSSSYDASYQEALKGAVSMAQAKAQAIAAASQKTISSVIRIEEQGYNPSARYSGSALRATAESDAAKMLMEDLNVMPGEIAIEAYVTADFAIQD